MIIEVTTNAMIKNISMFCLSVYEHLVEKKSKSDFAIIVPDHPPHVVRPTRIRRGIQDGPLAEQRKNLANFAVANFQIGNSPIIREAKFKHDLAGTLGELAGVQEVIPALLHGGDERGVVG